MKVRLSAAASTFIREETRYLKVRSTSAAKTFTAHVAKARRKLSEFAELGFEADDLPVDGMRRLVVGNYLFDYEVIGKEVHVVAVRSGRQLPADSEPDFDYENDPSTGYGP